MSQYSSVADAKAQAAEFFGFAAGEDIPITLPDGTVEKFNVPFPGLLNDDQQERWDELQFEISQCDRHPDVVIPDHKLTHKVTEHAGTENERIEETEQFVPGRTVRGQVIVPYQKTKEDGTVELLKPGYNARLAIALWGEDRYERFRANGGESRLISLLQQKMQQEFNDRKASDPKSGGGAGGVGEVPEADSDRAA
ncbi:hypothetical protein [Mycolicibacterium vaccae]|uniref:hypothetical protein n=1 Tax=Mycolicibacterium vaccae TaxID=1810 RepID=UPI003D016B8B